MMKKITALALSAALAAGTLMQVPAFAYASQETEEDGQNPVMNYVGIYGLNRCTIEVQPSGSSDANVSVTWGASAWETGEWEMSGPFDQETKTITYDNAVNKNVVFDDNGDVKEETVVYENGKGSFTFEDTEDGTVLTWNDEENHIADGSEFINFLPSPLEDETGDVAMFEMDTELEDGVLTVRISPEAAGGAFSWRYDDTGADRKVEVITDTTDEAGYAYAGSFRGIADGEDVIRLVFSNGVYVQQYMDLNVTVKDGKIVENNGGSQAFPTLHDELAEVIGGTWVEENGSRIMTLELGAVDGLDVTVSDGSGRDGRTGFYEFTAYYDAVEDGLIYRDGTNVEADITSDETEGETQVKTDNGTGTGIIRFEAVDGDEFGLKLVWQDDESDEGPVSFIMEE